MSDSNIHSTEYSNEGMREFADEHMQEHAQFAQNSSGKRVQAHTEQHALDNDCDHSHEHDHSHAHNHEHVSEHAHEHSHAHIHEHDHEHSHAHIHEHTHIDEHGHSYTHAHVHSDGAHHHDHGHIHSAEHTKAVLNRMSRIIGHMESTKRMVESGRDCSEVLIQLSAIESAINSVSRVILKEHLSTCIIDAVRKDDIEAIEELNRAIDKFIK